jgi:hypothetical protein
MNNEPDQPELPLGEQQLQPLDPGAIVEPDPWTQLEALVKPTAYRPGQTDLLAKVHELEARVAALENVKHDMAYWYTHWLREAKARESAEKRLLTRDNNGRFHGRFADG